MSVWLVLRHVEDGHGILAVCSTRQRAQAVATYWRSPGGSAGYGHAVYRDAYVLEYAVDEGTHEADA